MTIKRRDFLHKSLLLSTAGIMPFWQKEQFDNDELYQGDFIKIEPPEGRNYYLPLEQIKIQLSGPEPDWHIKLWDGKNNNYRSGSIDDLKHLKVGGCLGYQKTSLHDKNDQILDWVIFPVDCQTTIEDENGEFAEVFQLLYGTLFSSIYSRGKTVRYNQKYYSYYSSWFQDHVFVAEGMKYFLPEIKTGIDLYADGQREDGLIWDNYKHPYPDKHSYWEYRFDYGGFTYRPEDPQSSALFVRIPVENIGEHTFLEGLYYAWKATGDDEWMKQKLDNALKAVKFTTSSPWYWSENKQLLKRPFTIDRWDFQSDFDTEITGKDFMGADLQRTRYGIMYGDNICMANGCKYLAEMLRVADRNAEANQMEQLAEDLYQRINDLSWNGNFYRHWVPLSPKIDLDFGVDESKQVTLSNAMALIRGIDHNKAVQIIKTYQQLQKEMPETCPGEWFLCYPPFEKGWHINQWEYMNGGVSPIVAGDLALGAFEHGFEAYGVDILRRTYQVALKSNHRLRGAYKGKIQAPPARQFTTIDLSQHANYALKHKTDHNAPGWGSSKADLANLPTGQQTFDGVPFQIAQPQNNQEKVIIVVGKSTNVKKQIALEQKAKSIYLLQTIDGGNNPVIFSIHYQDGTYESRYMQNNQQIGHFWYPTISEKRKGIPDAIIAWKGESYQVKEVGVYAFGMNNPHPEKEISHVEFYNPTNARWGIIGLTLSNGEHYFTPSIVSTIPDHWAAAHVLKAMIEGLAGIKNTGVAFDESVLAPRWSAANVQEARATAKYECSGGYMAYEYSRQANQYQVLFTNNSRSTQVKLLLPEDKKAKQVLVNDKPVQFSIKDIESSSYAVFTVEGPSVNQIIVEV